MRVMRGFSIPGDKPFRDGYHVSFSMFVDRKGVMDRIDAKSLKVLGRTGAYVRSAMQRSIKPPSKSKKLANERYVFVRSVRCFVPPIGKVVVAGTKNPVRKKMADEARRLVAIRLRGKGVGEPPRRGVTDLLRMRIFFGVETETETVVIGPEKFPKQPRLMGAVSVPELLDKGGSEYSSFFGWSHYEPRPFVEPLVPLAKRKMRQFIEETPL